MKVQAKSARSAAAILLMTCFMSAPAMASGKMSNLQGGPVIIKYTVQVTAERLLHYWKQPEVDNYWSWMPRVSFSVMGPVNAGTVFTLDFTNSDGSPWYSVECMSDPVAAGAWGRVSTPAITTHVDKRTTLATGVFGIKVRVKNEVMGTTGTLFTGKFKVGKFHVGNNLPQFKNQFEYYVEHDWMLPIGYLWFNPRLNQNAPGLVATMWFRGELDDTKVAAYLFYKGKQIASTKSESGSAGSDAKLLTSGNDKDPRWERWSFYWNTVRGYNADPYEKSPQLFILNQNPGEYEVKVLRDGELSRSAKFTVGGDGKIVDNGLSRDNNLGWLGIVMPVKVIGAGEGNWDANAWKTEAFYGNPLTGFAAP